MLIDDGRIAAVGEPGDLRSSARAATVIDCGSSYVSPGLINAHEHPRASGGFPDPGMHPSYAPRDRCRATPATSTGVHTRVEHTSAESLRCGTTRAQTTLRGFAPRSTTFRAMRPGRVVNGRDHNPFGFSIWLAGGGIKGGMTYGATDDFGFRAVENPVHVHDLHATILHLMGIDHAKLTYRYSGRDFRLTDVHGRVIHEVIA